MPGPNTIVASVDTLAPGVESTTSLGKSVRMLTASVVGAVAIYTGHDARAAEAGTNLVDAKAACMADAKANLARLLPLIEMKKAAGESDKAAMIQKKYDDGIAESDKSCDEIAQNKAEIAQNKAEIAQNKAEIAQIEQRTEQNLAEAAQNKAEIAQIAEVEQAGKALDEEIQARLKIVDSFAAGNIPDANDNIALLNKGEEYLKKARAIYTDEKLLAKLNVLEASLKRLSAHLHDERAKGKTK